LTAIADGGFELWGLGLKELSIPIFTGIIGYITNWTAVIMLFSPLEYHGFRVPGLKPFVPFLPKKLKLVPLGLSDAKFGWQGIIPSRASKMGSIAVDKGLFLLGKPRDFYNELDPAKIAEQIVAGTRDRLPQMVDRIMDEQQPELWGAMPPRARRVVYGRVQAQLPEIATQVADDIGENIDQVLDVKLMVIRKMEERPMLANEIFHELGRKELVTIQNLGFVFGFVQGIPLMILTVYVHTWVILPFVGIIIGFVTNKLALDMIFEPIEPRHFFGIKFHGLFLRRQHEIAEIYAGIISREIITVANLSEEMMTGPRSDRMRRMVEDRVRGTIDNSLGVTAPVVSVVGGRQYRTIRDSLAAQTMEFATVPLEDPEFNERQSAAVATMLTGKVRTLDYKNFSEMLRTAIHDDEWLVLAHGGALGLVAGMLHVVLFDWIKVLG
jgi:uncharacterized membrane protein YheB (UPF0754 family)